MCGGWFWTFCWKKLNNAPKWFMDEEKLSLLSVGIHSLRLKWVLIDLGKRFVFKRKFRIKLAQLAKITKLEANFFSIIWHNIVLISHNHRRVIQLCISLSLIPPSTGPSPVARISSRGCDKHNWTSPEGIIVRV